jgi:hypothetical protein
MGTTGVDMKQIQGAGETRIAAAAGVPPVIVGLSEGLQAATYSNYGQARRRFADNTMRPLWRNASGSLETLVRPPNAASRLWYDDRDIQALAEDKKDLAEVRQLEAQQIGRLLDAGFKAESVVDATMTGDWSQLQHSGLFSVQLQPPQPDGPPVPVAPVAVPAAPPKRDEVMADLLRALASRPQPDVRMSMEPGAIVVNTPDVVFNEGAIRGGDTHITTPDVHIDAPVTVEPAQVTIADGAIRSETTVEAPEVKVVNQTPMRTVIDYAPDGITVIGDHEERMEAS